MTGTPISVNDKVTGKAGVFWHTQGSANCSGYKFKVGVFRVSDWSGTPQRGNPREEYSGKRDPAAFEPGHAQTTHGMVVVTDRYDLDGQLFQQFSSAKDLLKQTPV
jgi:hypothetical protein